MNFDTKEEKLKYFIHYLESQDMLVERRDDVDQVPGFGEIECFITASKIETFEGDVSSEKKANAILKEEGNVALINEMKENDLEIKPLFVSEVMVYAMKDEEGEFFALKTIAQLSSTPEYQQVLHKGVMDMNSPKEEFVAFIDDSKEGIDELKVNMENYNKKNN